MTTALQHTSQSDWQVLTEQATMLVKSQFLPQSIKTPEQAVAIILQGRELGIGTMAALQTINVIQGKPTVSPQLMLALINRSGQLEDMKMEATAQGAICMMKRKGRHGHTVKFGMAEAQALQLSGKDNYKKQPATMFQWRAVAMCARVVFPDVILGLYTPDEMGADVEPETGSIPPDIEVASLPSALPDQTTSAEWQEHAELDHAINLAYSDLVDLREAARETDSSLKSLPDLTTAINFRLKVEGGLEGLDIPAKKDLLAAILQNRQQDEAQQQIATTTR
jgi:hypothetical protein